MTKEERQLRENIAKELDRLQREYRERAQPYISMLIELDMLTPPARIIVSAEDWRKTLERNR